MTERDGPCTGVCCERFPIGGKTHAELLEILDSRVESKEAATIRDMIIPIPADSQVPYDTYTCKHWDRETKLCTNYEGRPLMCSSYPYDGRCKHCGMVFRVQQMNTTRTAALSGFQCYRWEHYEAVAGVYVPEEDRMNFFSCSC